MRYRTDYSAQSLSSEPDILFLDGWQLRYQAFAARADDPRPPVLLLGAPSRASARSPARSANCSPSTR